VKKYIIGFLITAVIFLLSIIKRNSQKPVLNDFPLVKIHKNKKIDNPSLYVYIYFTKNNCYDCLRVVDVLNNLPSYFIVKGVVPEKDLKNEKLLRETTGAEFELVKLSSRFYRFLPNYAPTIFGAGKDGKVYFVLPAVPGEKEYLKKFLNSFYYKTFHLLKVYEKRE